MVLRRKGHGRKPNAAELPRRREVIDLTDAEKSCPCCAGVRVRIGETVRERLDYTPASIFVRELAQQTYACRNCERAGHDPRIAAADFPPEPVPRSGIGAGLLAQVIVSKFLDHLPLYRQEAIFARHGWPVCRTRPCDLLAAGATLLEPICRLMVTRLKGSFAIDADESAVKLLQPRRTAYAWLYLGDAAHPYTAFDLTSGRGEEHPAAFLKGYAGFVQADDYAGYNPIHGSGSRHLGCWAHVRRKFVEARAHNPAKSSEALAYIRTPYSVEKDIVEKKLAGDSVVSLRQARAGPVPTEVRRAAGGGTANGVAEGPVRGGVDVRGEPVADAGAIPDRRPVRDRQQRGGTRVEATGRRSEELAVRGRRRRPVASRDLDEPVRECEASRAEPAGVPHGHLDPAGGATEYLPDIWGQQHLPTGR